MPRAHALHDTALRIYAPVLREHTAGVGDIFAQAVKPRWGRWGGRGSNPRPAGYEKADPVHVFAGRRTADRFPAGQPGCAGTGGHEPELAGTGRVFSQCSHPEVSGGGG